MARSRPKLLALLPLLAADCLANWVCGGSIRHTLSCEAWHQRADNGWCDFINRLFRDPTHCERAARHEQTYGSMWAGWWFDFKGA